MPTIRTSVTGSLGRGRLCTCVFGGYVNRCVMWSEESRASEEEEEERGGGGLGGWGGGEGGGRGGGGGIWDV